VKHFMQQPRWWGIGGVLLQLGACTTANVTPTVDVNTGTSTSAPATPPTAPESGTAATEAAPRPTPKLPPSYTESQTTKHPAVIALLSEAAQQENNGDLEIAAAKLERALRIEPRNAVLWHHLAAVRLRQGQNQLAASLAQKSNSFAANDNELIERNKRIIEEARVRN
jgi:hypothetical protein